MLAFVSGIRVVGHVFAVFSRPLISLSEKELWSPNGGALQQGENNTTGQEEG